MCGGNAHDKPANSLHCLHSKLCADSELRDCLEAKTAVTRVSEVLHHIQPPPRVWAAGLCCSLAGAAADFVDDNSRSPYGYCFAGCSTSQKHAHNACTPAACVCPSITRHHPPVGVPGRPNTLGCPGGSATGAGVDPSCCLPASVVPAASYAVTCCPLLAVLTLAKRTCPPLLGSCTPIREAATPGSQTGAFPNVCCPGGEVQPHGRRCMETWLGDRLHCRPARNRAPPGNGVQH
jgi:hypothetical protein